MQVKTYVIEQINLVFKELKEEEDAIVTLLFECKLKLVNPKVPDSYDVQSNIATSPNQ